MADLRSLLVALSGAGQTLAERSEIERAARLREVLEEARLQRQIQLEEAREGRATATRQSELAQMSAEERAQAERILATLRPKLREQLSGLRSPGEISAAVQLRKGRGGERRANLKDMVEQIRSVAALGVGPEDLLPRLEAAQQLRGKQRLQAVRSLLNEALQAEGALASEERTLRRRSTEALIGRRDQLSTGDPDKGFSQRLQALKERRAVIKAQLDATKPKGLMDVISLPREEQRRVMAETEAARQSLIQQLAQLDQEILSLVESLGGSPAEEDLADLARAMGVVSAEQ